MLVDCISHFKLTSQEVSFMTNYKLDLCTMTIKILAFRQRNSTQHIYCLSPKKLNFLKVRNIFALCFRVVKRLIFKYLILCFCCCWPLKNISVIIALNQLWHEVISWHEALSTQYHLNSKHALNITATFLNYKIYHSILSFSSENTWMELRFAKLYFETGLDRVVDEVAVTRKALMWMSWHGRIVNNDIVVHGNPTIL